MGFLAMTFFSHFLFGFGLTVLGTWWAISVSKRYVSCRLTNRQFESCAFYPHEDWPNIPVEPILKSVFLVIQFSVELLTSYSPLDCSQTLDLLWRSVLLLHTYEEIFLFYYATWLKREVPYLCLIISASVIGIFLPLLPSDGTPVFLQEFVVVQQLFSFSICALIMVTIFEMVEAHSLALALARAGCTVLIGLWLMTLAVILNPPISYFSAWQCGSPRCVKDIILLFGCLAFMAALYTIWISSQVLSSLEEKSFDTVLNDENGPASNSALHSEQQVLSMRLQNTHSIPV